MTTLPDFFRSDFDTGFEGSFSADVLWRDRAGDDVLWYMNNDTLRTIETLPSVTPDWHVKATADFDQVGGGNADILWQNDNGALALWQMNGTTFGLSAVHALPNPGPSWHVAGDNDFNGDRADDIFFQNDNGALELWTVTSAETGTVSGVFAGIQNPGPTWHVVGTGDTNGDGVAGILWQNDNDRTVALWEDPIFVLLPSPLQSSFAFATVAAVAQLDPSWHVKGMADVNGDLRADVVLQNDSGAVAVWEMGGTDGTTITAVNLVDLNPGPAWHIVGLRSADGLSHGPDIFFQNDNGAAAVWEGYHSLNSASATFDTVLAITPNPNPNGPVWDLL